MRTLIFHLRMHLYLPFSSGEGKQQVLKSAIRRAIHNAVCSAPPWNFTWPFITVLVVFRKRKKKTKKTLKTADLHFCLHGTNENSVSFPPHTVAAQMGGEGAWIWTPEAAFTLVPFASSLNPVWSSFPF